VIRLRKKRRYRLKSVRAFNLSEIPTYTRIVWGSSNRKVKAGRFSFEENGRKAVFPLIYFPKKAQSL